MSPLASPLAPFELNTSISNLRHLRASDLGPYDAVYLGNIYCQRYEANFLERRGDLAEAIHILRDQGKRAYLTTYAAPRSDAIAPIRRALETAVTEGAAAVEVHSLGLVKVVRDDFPGLPIHVGNFASVYTDAGVEVLKGFGVARVTLNYELPLDEVDVIAREGGILVEVVVHGKLPLGVSESCFLLDYEATWGIRCPDLCQGDVFLRKEDWALKSVGKGILSGRDVSMLEHLPRLISKGHRHFRIEAVSEDPTYRHAVGATYREALDRALQGDPRSEPRWWETLQGHARLGLSNGFYFGKSGMDYAGAAIGAETNPDPEWRER
jgi:putative protease